MPLSSYRRPPALATHSEADRQRLPTSSMVSVASLYRYFDEKTLVQREERAAYTKSTQASADLERLCGGIDGDGADIRHRDAKHDERR